MIDWARIAELKNDVGDDAFTELRDVFLSEVEDALARLSPEAGRSALERNLHFLKGSALNIGLAEFARLCSAGEAAAQINDITADDLAQIIAAYHDGRTELLGETDQV